MHQIIYHEYQVGGFEGHVGVLPTIRNKAAASHAAVFGAATNKLGIEKIYESGLVVQSESFRFFDSPLFGLDSLMKIDAVLLDVGGHDLNFFFGDVLHQLPRSH
ncbi:MAG TPA: hypothetical protein DCM71_04310 [Runella sp.]|nr:hypothetical protein [Runella sp.]